MADVRVAIVDDDPIVRQALGGLLRRIEGIRLTACLAGGAVAVQHASADAAADVYLVDLHMPGVDGLATAIGIKQANPAVRAVILTSHASAETVSAAKAAGLDGFVMKTADPEQIVRVIRGAEPQTMGAGPTNQAAQVVTQRERELLDALCLGKSNAAIAAELNLSESRVKSLVSALMQRFGAESRLQLAVTVLRQGICRL